MSMRTIANINGWLFEVRNDKPYLNGEEVVFNVVAKEEKSWFEVLYLMVIGGFVTTLLLSATGHLV